MLIIARHLGNYHVLSAEERVTYMHDLAPGVSRGDIKNCHSELIYTNGAETWDSESKTRAVQKGALLVWNENERAI